MTEKQEESNFKKTIEQYRDHDEQGLKPTGRPKAPLTKREKWRRLKLIGHQICHYHSNYLNTAIT